MNSNCEICDETKVTVLIRLRDRITSLRVCGNSANACGSCQKTTYAHARMQIH